MNGFLASLHRPQATPTAGEARPFRRVAALFCGLLSCLLPGPAAGATPAWWAPSALLVQPEAATLYLGGRSGLVLATNRQGGDKGWTTQLSDSVTGLAWADQPARVLVTSADQSNTISILDPSTGGVLATWPAGHGVCSPVVSPGRKRLYVCNRFDHAIGVHALTDGQAWVHIPVLREPIAAALSPDERLLAVANHLPEGAANAPSVAAAVTLIDTGTDTVRTHIRLPNGSTSLQGIALSPSGAQCAVVHTLARFQVPTTQLEHGWMNVSALSLIDLPRGSLLATVLLDEPRRGAANPWAVAWSPDGRLLCVTHAGTHELSVIDAPALNARLATQPAGQLVPNLDFLRGIRHRVALPGKGPRALVVAGRQAYIAEFFSDTVSLVDLDQRAVTGRLALGPEAPPSLEREGERLFHDATISRQGWQSCASCHPDGRADGLNWDLLNDGIGNPKNTKSLVWSHQTPPAMSTGARTSAAQAVRAGLRHILFAVPDEAQAQAIEAYLRSLRPVRSPYLADGALAAPIKRGQRLFEDPQVGCAVCHPAPLFTDLKAHAVGTAGRGEAPGTRFDPPTLAECWRTAPYLHDGSAATLYEVLKTRNPEDRHGNTSHLNARELGDLAVYVLTL